MTNSNDDGNLRPLVLAIAQSLNQFSGQQLGDRLSEFIETSNENFSRFHEAYQVAQLERAELRQAQREMYESVIDILPPSNQRL